MNKKYLVVLKNPGTSFMVDSCEKGFLKHIKYAAFIQEDKMLWIPVSTDCNVAYVMEMSEEDVAAFEEKIATLRSQIVKPKFKFPVEKPS